MYPREGEFTSCSVQKGKAGPARDEVLRRLAHLALHGIDDLSFQHRVAPDEPLAKLSPLCNLGDILCPVAIGVCSAKLLSFH